MYGLEVLGPSGPQLLVGGPSGLLNPLNTAVIGKSMDGEKSNKNHQVIQTLSPRNPKQITKKSKKFTEISIKITAKSIFCLEY